MSKRTLQNKGANRKGGLLQREKKETLAKNRKEQKTKVKGTLKQKEH